MGTGAGPPPGTGGPGVGRWAGSPTCALCLGHLSWALATVVTRAAPQTHLRPQCGCVSVPGPPGEVWRYPCWGPVGEGPQSPEAAPLPQHTPLGTPGLYIQTLLPGSPAAADGRLALGDRILEVNGSSLAGVSYPRYLPRPAPPGG